MIDCKIDVLLVGQVAPLGARGEPSAIDKQPMQGPMLFDEMGFLPDDQGDKKAHGGAEKAIHHYPFDHYASWLAVFKEKSLEIDGPDMSLPGAFGENISTVGFTEGDVCLGDIFQLGTGRVQIAQGRQPCWKLNERFGNKTMSRLVQKSGMTGWYYRVLEPGEVQAGDHIKLLERLAPEWPLSRVIELLFVKTADMKALEQVVALPFLAQSWRGLMERRLRRGVIEDWTGRLDGRSK